MDSNPLPEIHIVGGGLAGVEAAYQCLKHGLKVVMHEMRPAKTTPAHKTGDLAELVCSNSFKSDSEQSAPGQLKWEMAKLDSLVVKSALECRVPAGQALAVDRVRFSAAIRSALCQFPSFSLKSEEVTSLPSAQEMIDKNQWWVVATGPLTSGPLVQAIEEASGSDRKLYFYDAIAPIINADSMDLTQGYWANRWDKGETADYFNIPLDKEQYTSLIGEILNAEKMPLHNFENAQYFESCLPIEVMAERGVDTLRFGPLKPVGLVDPRTGKRPWAVIQLRKENESGSMLSMVGFQTKMKWPEQRRVFGQLPCLENVEFYRYGSVHRNTYVEGPEILNPDLSLKKSPRLFLAGQITGVEGYTESSSIGLLVGLSLSRKIAGQEWELPPEHTMLGALGRYICFGGKGHYQPMNSHFGLLPTIQRKRGISKADVKVMKCQRAQDAFLSWSKGRINDHLSEVELKN